MRQTIKYTESEGFKLSRLFQKKISTLVKRFTNGGYLEDDGYIHLPKEIDVDIIDYHGGKPKLKHITVGRLTLDTKIVGDNGKEYLPEMLRLFDWEIILRILENGSRNQTANN